MTTDFVLSPDVAQLHFILADEKHKYHSGV